MKPIFLTLLSALLCSLVSSQTARCVTPAQWEGDMQYKYVDHGERNFFAYNFAYDDENERVAVEVNMTEPYPQLKQVLLYRERVAYEERLDEKTCTKSVLNDTYPKIKIPPSAEYIGVFYVGSESISLGVAVNMWRFRDEDGNNLMSMTAKGCLPVTRTAGNFTVVESYYNIKLEVNSERFLPCK